ncbi:MAG TPA: thioredoxin domain-containing protein [Gemmatimonadales bacterium]|jgi:protein-disulfide isomerase
MPPLLDVPVSSQDHILGPASAAVTLVEYGDFECPNCLAAYPIIRGLLETYNDRLRFVFRHFPIVLSHDHAQKAAEAAEAAGAQGKFWEMHDLLFEHQDALDPESLLAYARTLGLDVERFGRELSEGTYADRVYEDRAGGEVSGVSWTPTFFLNGDRYPIARDLDGLVRQVNERALAPSVRTR